ncbi:auxilin-related protein 2 [Quercus suber]|uniref:Auxilin-related protein 2 n=1 Tax=Quercus suber TaxID=58331 RepID=A0AAW0LT36_QUESU
MIAKPNTSFQPRRRGSRNSRPEDFADVFGGPPRSVLMRKFSGDFFKNNGEFYGEVFRPPEFELAGFQDSVEGGGGGGGGGFYGDIFGSEDDLDRKSRERSRPNSKAKSKSKSNSSSVLSSEDLSPLHRPAIGDDVALSSFVSKLRPINIPSRWNSSIMPKEYSKKQGKPTFLSNSSSYTEQEFIENEYNENFRSFYNGFPKRVSSPETISLEPSSYQSVKVSVDDLELMNSPASVVSSLHQDREAESGFQDHVLPKEEVGQEEDEVMSSYVIEINFDHREGTSEATSIDEAIAWAKEKFQTHSEKDLSTRPHDNEQNVEREGRTNASELSDQPIDEHGMIQSTKEEEQRNWTAEEEKLQPEKDVEVELLDECIRVWSAGKETNIKLLLSELHQVLWPNSGWYAIPLTSLTESTLVKKAYQKQGFVSTLTSCNKEEQQSDKNILQRKLSPSFRFLGSCFAKDAGGMSTVR